MEDLIKAIKIFAKYSDAEWPTHCEHDVLIFNTVDKGKVSKDDIKRLDKLGFLWSKEYEAFISFKYGSN